MTDKLSVLKDIRILLVAICLEIVVVIWWLFVIAINARG
jgi:hypothetical protein